MSTKPGPCANADCKLQVAANGKYMRLISVAEWDRRFMRYCGYHNVCKSCGQVTCWEESLCIDCDTTDFAILDQLVL